MKEPLILNYRDVAKTNLTNFDRLGAFHGQISCLYHYPETNLGCAIGICDPENVLDSRYNTSVVEDLVAHNIISTDNIYKLGFIQELHDFIISPQALKFHDLLGFVRHPEYKDILSNIQSKGQISEEDYKQIMKRLSEEPIE